MQKDTIRHGAPLKGFDRRDAKAARAPVKSPRQMKRTPRHPKPSRARPYPGHAIQAGMVCLLCMGLAFCATDREPAADMITVEGTVAVRGNEPFARYVLETPDRNAYILVFREAVETPARLRVTGRLYLEDWMGRSHAHIEVHTYEELFE